MKLRQVRYKAIPSIWPSNSNVFIDYSSGVTKQYVTDEKGVPSFVSRYYTPPVVATAWGTITGTLSDQVDLQAALDAKQDLLISGTNIKTINGTSVLGSGNIAIIGLSDGDKGDIVVSASGTTWVVDALAITNSKINDVDATKVTEDTTHRFVTDAQILAWNAILGGVVYQGVWNATTNSPTLVSGVGTAGHYYIVSVAGSTTIDGISDWKVGDWIIFNGITWNKVDNTDAVSSVNALTGAVLLDSSNVPDTTNKRYVTDAHLVILGNTSNTNSGDETVSTLGAKIAAAASGTPNDTDYTVSVDAGVLKKNTWTQIKAFLKTYFDPLYVAAAAITDYFNKTTDDTDDITVGATNKFATAAEKTKVAFISVTQAVDLDIIESDTVLNNAKVTNATHTGDAAGATVLTLATVNGNVGTFGSATQVAAFTVNGKGLITSVSAITITPAIGSITGLGTGIAAALAIAIGSAGAPVLFNGALGTPSSGTGTNLTGIPQSGVTNLVSDLAAKAPLASPVLTGTPTLAAASATTLNVGGGTLDGKVFVKSTTVISLSSTAHALTVGNDATGNNFAMGLYGSVLALQARNNGAAQAFYLNPLGGDIVIGDGALTGQRYFAVHNSGAGTGDYASIEVRNGAAGTDALRLWCMGTAYTTAAMQFQDGAVMSTGTGISGGLSIGTQASADLRFYTANTLRLTLAAATGNADFTGYIKTNLGGIGYSTGSGVAATQATSRTTTVSTNRLCGTIAMFSSAKASQTSDTFTLTNTQIEVGDNLIVVHNSTTDGGCWCISTICAAGSAQITVRNVSGGSITSATPLKFTLIKGVTS